MKQQSSSIVTLALILAAGGTNLKAIAQTAADKFPLPASVATGTKVQIDGSSSMQAVNQGLKERFEKQFSGANVVVPTQYQGSDNGVKAVAEDKADLAGIGRALTTAEKAQGLTAKSIGRSKIAIIVKDGNPYQGNLTLNDFAKIYRGEVTDWSQLPSAKGAKGKIKVIDRPDTSDTRRAFANYPVFQNGKLKTGSNAQKLTEDSTQAVVDKLGDDGIGYAPADQIKDIKGIRSVTLHGAQPDNPKYPFSQPLAYAYKSKDGKITEGTKAFLGYASAPAGQLAIKELLPGAVATMANPATPETATTTTTETTTGATGANSATEATNPGTSTTTTETTTTTAAKPDKGGLPWWLILLPIGGLLLWLLGRKKPTDTVTTITPPPDVTTPGIKPLYPPPPTRTARGEGLSGDLSGDLSSSLGGYRPSGDLRSGDLRSGDLSGTLPPRPNLDTQPNINFNGVVDPVKNKAGDINLAGGAAIAGGAAAAAAVGKGIFVGGASQNENRVGDGVGELHPPAVDPAIDLSNPLEGLKDKSSNLMPDLDISNPLDGIKGKFGDSIEGTRGTDLNLELPKVNLDGIPAKTGDLNPQGDGILDRVGDFLKDGGGAAIAGGGAVIAGGAALAGGAGKSASNFFGGQKDLDLSEDLSLESANTNDPFNFGTPLESANDRVADLIPDFNNDPFDFGNPLEGIQDKAGELKDNAADLIPDFNNDPFDFGNPLEGIQDKAGELKDNAADLIPDLKNEPFDFNNPFDGIQDKAGDFLSGGGAAAGAAGAAALAGGAALFGGAQNQQTPSESRLNPEMDTFDRDLDAISLDDLDEDPFAGLSDLLGEETGDIGNEESPPASSGFMADFKDKASDLLENSKDFGGAALAGGAAATVGAGKAIQSFFTSKENPAEDRGELSGNLYSEGQITLVSPNPTKAYAHWEIPVRLKRELREQGGQRLMVRLYNVTNFDSNIELPATFQEFECSDSAWDLEIPISQSEHRYLAEIGYVTADNRWLMLARSTPLWIRANQS